MQTVKLRDNTFIGLESIYVGLEPAPVRLFADEMDEALVTSFETRADNESVLV